MYYLAFPLQGNRARVPAIVGSTLLEAAQYHLIDIEGSCHHLSAPVSIKRTDKWTEDVYGEGPSCFLCHVQIPSSYNHILPERSLQEIEGLDSTWEEEFKPTSRLACTITLDHRHDGMIVLVPDAPPTDVI